MRVSHGLQVSYSSGDRLRTPLGLRYQYRMKKGNILGMDFSSLYNPIVITPQYMDNSGTFGGPSMAYGRSMTGFNIHYSKTIDIKILEVFGMAGLGAYVNGNLSGGNTDFAWYQGGSPEFYTFAPVVTNTALKRFLPVMVFGCGVRLWHLEAGMHNQISISSPVRDFTYNGYTHTVPLSWKSLGYYIGYRFEF